MKIFVEFTPRDWSVGTQGYRPHRVAVVDTARFKGPLTAERVARALLAQGRAQLGTPHVEVAHYWSTYDR